MKHGAWDEGGKYGAEATANRVALGNELGQVKILVIENWGLGDAVLMTTALQALLLDGHLVEVLAQGASIDLLRPSYPVVTYTAFKWPWTAFRGKYRIWRWRWRGIYKLIMDLRRRRFDVALSVRADPRDHLIMWACGARRRIGFPRLGSGVFLTQRLLCSGEKQHRVVLWRRIAGRALSRAVENVPHLEPSRYVGGKVGVEAQGPTPWLVVHCGAAQSVRRWPERYFRGLVQRIKEEMRFRVAVIPDADGYGGSLRDLADTMLEGLSVADLVVVLGKAMAVVCNDSGPAHIAAALGTPVCAVFGPQNPDEFRPFGEMNKVLVRDVCPFRPCNDYCRQREALCMTAVTVESVWEEVRSWLRIVDGSRGDH